MEFPRDDTHSDNLRPSHTMAIKNKKNGFALLIAVIFMSVMLAIGLALGSISYKQQVLASDAIRSQYAFYAADAGLECALFADQQMSPSLFAYAPDPAPAPSLTCGDATTASGYPTMSRSASQWVIKTRLSMDSNTRCADVTVYKPASSSGTTYIFSQGYDVSCSTVSSPSGARFTARGIQVHY